MGRKKKNVPTIDEVVERARDAAGADFAFLLTMKGRLVTRDAPRDMPEAGRRALVEAAGTTATMTEQRGAAGRGASRVAELTLPRQELVPFGGAAPVDVFVAVACEQGILALVMSTWADKTAVFTAIDDALAALAPLIDAAASKRAGGASASAKVAPARPAAAAAARPAAAAAARPAAGPTRSTAALASRAGATAPAMPAARPAGSASKAKPPSAPDKRPGKPRGSKQGAPMAGLLTLTRGEAALDSRQGSPSITSGARAAASAPQIVIGEAEIGRYTMEAIEADAIGYSQGPSSAPDVRVELTSIGRATMEELQREEDARTQSLVRAPDPLLASAAAARATQPWVESPSDTKRATEAAVLGRKLAVPRVTVKLDDADSEVIEAALVDEVDAPASSDEPDPSPRAPSVSEVRPSTPATSEPKVPQPSLDVWREALDRATRGRKDR
jgi:hypothetical protein